jgi:dienelactone hydrolase
MKPDLGVYYDMLDSIARKPPSLSFLAKSWPDMEAWRNSARARVFELLAFNPPSIPLNPVVHSKSEDNGLITEEISYAMPYGPRAYGFFLYPKSRSGKLPALVALHDHGGFFYFGKEKITTTIKDELKILSDFKRQYYGGRSWATELAQRGFAVLAMDVFMWGSRKIPLESVNEDFQKPFKNVEPDSEEYIRKYNEFWEINECPLVADSILEAGTTWPGIFAYEDRRSVDYLITRPEVDSNKIGCGGLSGGGLRAVFLAGLDQRIKCGVCVGFMSTIRGVLKNHIKCPPGHGLLMYVPQLLSYLDLPDVISLLAPSPLMIQFNSEDELFSLEGQQDADRKISQIYLKMGCSNNYVGKFYAGPHKFDVVMQKAAFEWLENWLTQL